MNKLLSTLICLLLFVTIGCKRPPNGDGCIDRSKINTHHNCPKIYAPVCGCDGKTYVNDCVAKNNGVLKFTKGPCRNDTETKCIDETIIDKNRVCPDYVEPVCGCNNVTYKNECEAKKHGVTRMTKGKCPETNTKCIDENKIDLHKQCPDHLDPVCGCDNKTYKNECIALKHGVTRMTKGKCPENNTKCIDESKIDLHKQCPDHVDPVCGCDNKTYKNECIALKHGVTQMTKGKCPETNTKCIDESKIDKHKQCPDTKDPVCGCDNQTYLNECEARKHGVTHITKGPCPDNR